MRAWCWVVVVVVAAVSVAGAAGAVSADGLGDGGPGHHDPVVELSPLAAREIAAVRQPAAAALDGAQQGVSVVVEPGPLVILRAPSTVVLTRVPGTTTFRGTVGRVRVVDARGSDAGWRLRAQVVPTLSNVREHEGIDAPTVRVDRVMATAQSTEGIHARAGAAAMRGARTSILSADPGSGSGGFRVTLSFELVARVTARHVRVAVAFEVTEV